MSTTREAIAAEIRSVLARAQLTQSAAATEMGVSPMTMRRLMEGQTPLTIEQAILLAEIAGCNPSVFLPGQGRLAS